ncbi:MAG TPA: hypothetical protein VHB54_11035 [Mucilaginibacter sp.]|nr:hypothetical protein [Mucilaginibacter sp.]
MKKLILSGGILILLGTAFVLMSLTIPKSKAHVALKKPTMLTFTIYNRSSVAVSYTFKNIGGFGPGGVIYPGTTTPFSIAADTYQVILNDAWTPPTSFHMLFNTGENAYAPGHTFYGIVVSPSQTTSLQLY